MHFNASCKSEHFSTSVMGAAAARLRYKRKGPWCSSDRGLKSNVRFLSIYDRQVRDKGLTDRLCVFFAYVKVRLDSQGGNGVCQTFVTRKDRRKRPFH